MTVYAVGPATLAPIDARDDPHPVLHENEYLFVDVRMVPWA
jgi:hypothetical protein